MRSAWRRPRHRLITRWSPHPRCSGYPAQAQSTQLGVRQLPVPALLQVPPRVRADLSEAVVREVLGGAARQELVEGRVASRLPGGPANGAYVSPAGDAE